jgi:glutaredoxin
MNLFNDLRQIAGQMNEHRVRLDLTIHPRGDEGDPERGLREMAEILAGSGGEGVILHRAEGGGVPARPALSFRFAGWGSVNYLALPEDQETGPFLEMLSSCLPAGPAIDFDLSSRLAGLAEPADIWIFIAPVCPYCPHAVRAANKLAAASDKVNTTIIDVALFPELAARFKVRSVPMIVINKELLIGEMRPAEDLAQILLARGTPAYRMETIESQVKTGNSELAADQLLRIDRSIPAFLEAWRRSTLSTRMGLYLAAEKALVQVPRILDDIVSGLVEMLDSSDIAVKGDTADLLGRIGHHTAKLPLERLLQDANPDIVEVAEEALKNLSSDHN